MDQERREDAGRQGQVVTFYSFKGGTGRTMALANVAWILAANGKKVLVADWDLDAPGLHRFFNPFIDAAAFVDTGGIIDLIREFEWATTTEHGRGDGWVRKFARVQKYAFSLRWDFPDGGTLDFLCAGRQNNAYSVTLNSLDWDNFYSELGGGQFFDALRADMKYHYDYTLIDSRTGLSDVAEICTVHLPDQLVDCFTFSEQGIDGAARVAHTIRDQHTNKKIRILPVPMRVDPAEKLKADAGRAVAMQRFAGLPADLSDDERFSYWGAVEVPYRPYYAYEETLATFGDQPGSPTSMLSAYETLTRYISHGEVTALPPMDETVRARASARFIRQLNVPEEEITLKYAPDDQVWAEWITHVLVSAGVRVNDPYAADANGTPPSSGRQLTIISHANSATERAILHREHGVRPPLAVYVDDIRPLPNLPMTTSAFIAGQSAVVAVERLLKLVGHPDAEVDAAATDRVVRYPGDAPVVFKAPARNNRFTGREDDLQHLRASLRSRGSAVVLQGAMPVALQGMGGIGKTQVAMEYAHRFRASYDVVWWIDSDPVTFIDTSLNDLAGRLEIPPQPAVPDTARAVVAALGRGEPHSRWLVIFDNAEDPAYVSRFIPQGAGHVLITSRNQAWGDHAQSIQIEVFDRSETVQHLQQRVPTIRTEEANRVGEVLGDLPIAVAAAGAWLADTGAKVDDYLNHVEQHGPGGAVAATWDLSFERLQKRSPAAYRLLQLCSVLAPEVALELVYSDELAAKLTDLEPMVANRMMRATLVQQINRLALLKLDVEGDRIQVHRLLQHVVRERMTPEELGEARHEVHLMLAASRPRQDVDEQQTWRRYRMLWPHLTVSEAVNCPDESVRQLLIDRIRYLWLRGDLQRGSDTAEQIDRTWSELLAGLEGTPAERSLRQQLLHMRFNHGNILRDLARFEDARDLDERTLAEQAALLGPHHADTLMTAGGYAADLRALGHYTEALTHDEATSAAWAEYFGEDHPRTLAALNNLASSHRLAGDFRSAMRYDERVYERRRLVHGETHPITLRSASNLGRDIREAGEYDRSVNLLRSVADVLAETYGADYPHTLNAEANLAVSLRSAGRAAEASSVLDRAYEQLNDTFGPRNPDTLACRLSRALNLLALQKGDRAATELEAVREAYQASLGPTHPHTLVCVNNQAAVARAAQDWSVARELAAHASDKLRDRLGVDHPYTIAARMNLAVCTAEVGDLEHALGLAREATAQLQRVLGPDHPDTLRGIANRALILQALRRGGPEADETPALEQLVHRVGIAHPAVIALRERRYLHRIVDPHPF